MVSPEDFRGYNSPRILLIKVQKENQDNTFLSDLNQTLPAYETCNR